MNTNAAAKEKKFTWVKAIGTGFDGLCVRVPGDVFEVEERTATKHATDYQQWFVPATAAEIADGKVRDAELQRAAREHNAIMRTVNHTSV